MQRLALLAVLSVLVIAVTAAQAPARPEAERARLAWVVDGDTIALSSGARVRLLQIDTPEPGTGECYSRTASRELRRLLPAGAALVLEPDAPLDLVDAYGRLLRYVWHGGRNVNLELVRRGAATVWLYRGESGRYAERLLAAARSARAAKRGLWGACPDAVWDPYGPATTGRNGPAAAVQPVAAPPPAGGRCDPSYPSVCIPPPPPDLDCADVQYRNFRVLPPDPHRFDGRDDDGVGCES
jgi:endonuclease YncB( thermonuclease family)